MTQDVVKQVLYYEQVSPWLLLGVLGVAFLLGGLHALSPGHGKSLMAAYLVASKGRYRDAVALALSLSLAHVLVVVVVALVALWLTDFFWPEKAARWFALGSGLAICAIGAWLFVKRMQGLIGARAKETARGDREGHDHHHHFRWQDDHRGLAHHHGDRPPGVPQQWANWKGAVALGLSSGLVPCPKALVILLLAVSLHRVALGLALVASFSLGMALVLVAIGLAMVKASHLVEHRLESRGVTVLGLLGALIIIALGVFLTLRSVAGS